MNLLLVILRSTLLLIFAFAAFAKLRDLRAMARTLTQFGVPQPWTRPASYVVAGSELLVAAALLPVATARYAALAALALLILFTAAVSYNLARGRKPACNCFGEISSRPIGPSTVVRNLVLGVAAALIVANGPGAGLSGAFAMLNSTRTLDVAAFAAVLGVVGVLVQGFLMVQVLQQQGRILQRLDALSPVDSAAGAQAAAVASAKGLGAGAVAPDFILAALSGKPVSLADLLAAGRSLLLVFMNPHCGPCEALVPELAGWMLHPPRGTEVVVISEGTAEENLGKADALIPSRVLLQQEREIADAYHAWGTPSAVVVNPDHRIGSSVAQGAEAIRALLQELGLQQAYRMPERQAQPGLQPQQEGALS